MARPWREAASLILAARKVDYQRPVDNFLSVLPRLHPTLNSVNVELNQCFRQREGDGVVVLDEADYEILFLTRNKKNKSFASAQVFPGGVVDVSDFSPKWFDVFGKVGITSNKDFKWENIQYKYRPPLLARKRDEDMLPNDVAFRLCAIREAFEECGILLVKPSSELSAEITSCLSIDGFYSKGVHFTGLSHRKRQDWRKRVYQNASEFFKLCQELDAVPDIWSLFEWSHFLTPGFVQRRYDTMFYICSLSSIPPVCIDDHEIVGMKWQSPAHTLNKCFTGNSVLFMPQQYECLRLLNFKNLSEVEDYSRRRMNEGTHCQFSLIYKLQDCGIEVFLGDDLFPKDFDLTDNSLPEINETIEENMRKSQNLHRAIHKGQYDKSLYINVGTVCEQVPPLSVEVHTPRHLLKPGSFQDIQYA